MKGKTIWLVAITLLSISTASWAETLGQEEKNPLSAWIRMDIDLARGKDVVGRTAEVFLTKGNFVPFDMYYFDSGDGSYQEVGVTAGFKAFSALGMDFWALPYFVSATDSDYLGLCMWLTGTWGKWNFSSLPMFYLPLDDEGTEQFTTCGTYLNYKVNDWLQVGVGGVASWTSIGDDEWSWRLGPNFVIQDPIKILPHSIGDFAIRPTWDQDGEWRLFLQKTFTF